MIARGVREAVLSSLRPRADVRVHVPSRDRHGRTISLLQFSQRAESLLLHLASGTTNLKGEGVWQQEPGRVVRERVLIVQSYLNATVTREAKNALVDGLIQLALDAHQVALAVVIDGRLFLLPGDSASDQQPNQIGEC